MTDAALPEFGLTDADADDSNGDDAAQIEADRQIDLEAEAAVATAHERPEAQRGGEDDGDVEQDTE